MRLKFLLLIVVITSIGASASDIDKTVMQKLFFYGTINKQPIRMILDRNNTTLNGFYYTPEGFTSDDMNISGTVSENGTLSLKNANNISFIGKWKQKPNKPIIIDGAIDAIKTAKKKSFHFEQEPIFLNVNQKILTREIFENYKEKNKHVSISMKYPQIQDSILADGHIVGENLSIDENIKSFKKGIDEVGSFDRKFFIEPYMEMDYTIKYLDTNYTSIVYRIDIYDGRQATWSAFWNVLNVNLSTGESIELSDLFNNNSYLNIISKYIREKLMSEYVREDKLYLQNIAPKDENFQFWTLTPNGIEFYFGKYLIGPGCDGMPHIIIPYKDFGNNFKLQLDGVGHIDEKSVDKLDKQILSSKNVKKLGSDIDQYKAKVQGVIYAHFHPESGTQGFSARVRIVLSADGKLDSYRVISSSGNALFNEALDSLKERLRQASFPKNPNRDEAIFEIILTSKN